MSEKQDNRPGIAASLYKPLSERDVGRIIEEALREVWNAGVFRYREERV